MDFIPHIIEQLAEASTQPGMGIVMPVLVVAAGLVAAGWWTARRKKAQRT